MKRFIFMIIMLITLAGCEKQTTWQLQQQPLEMVVVDALLTDETSIQKIRLSHTVTQLNEPASPFTGASVLLSDGNSSYKFSELPGGDGIYVLQSTPGFTPGKTYSLLITKGNSVYTAKTEMVHGSMFQELRYSKNSNNDLYHIDWVANAYNADKAAMYEILIDWSHLPAYSTTDSVQCTRKLFYYTLTTLDVSEIFAPAMEKISFPEGSIITERRYSLSPDFAAYIRAMLSETNWRGGLFDSAPASVPTNLSAGATGYFAVCSVTTLSVTVTP